MIKNKGGRPTVMTDEKIRQFKAICRLKPTLEDCSAFLEISPDAIIKYCNKIGTSFTKFREENMVHTRFMIIRNIIKACENNSVPMLIYASKNLCGWTDKPLLEELKFDDISLDDLEKIVNKGLQFIAEKKKISEVK